MDSGDEGHGEISGVDYVVDMIVFVRRFRDSLLEGLNGRVVDRYACVVMLENMAAITYRRLFGLGCEEN